MLRVGSLLRMYDSGACFLSLNSQLYLNQTSLRWEVYMASLHVQSIWESTVYGKSKREDYITYSTDILAIT